MLLTQLGAEVTQLRRPGTVPLALSATASPAHSYEVDLKEEAGREYARELINSADVLIEGFRPGAMERLGLGPDEMTSSIPGLIYCRMTGWGQHGPLAQKAGHDINFLAETGALSSIRNAHSKPAVPLNLVGDNGGGSLYLVTGILAALFERTASGEGCVLDVAIVDGVSSLLETLRDLQRQGEWVDAPASNLFDSGRPYYDTYECADGGYMAVGAIEAPFYAELLVGLGLDRDDLPDREVPGNWPALREIFTRAFLGKTRDEWREIFARLDACTSPVLSLDEAAQSTHLKARRTLRVDDHGQVHANPAPRAL